MSIDYVLEAEQNASRQASDPVFTSLTEKIVTYKVVINHLRTIWEKNAMNMTRNTCDL